MSELEELMRRLLGEAEPPNGKSAAPDDAQGQDPFDPQPRQTAQATAPRPAPQPEDVDDLSEPTPAPPPNADFRQARSFLTELHPSGFGELLVTDVWFPPAPKPVVRPAAAARPSWEKPKLTPHEALSETEERVKALVAARLKPVLSKVEREVAPPPSRQQLWEQRQEWRELNLLRERPTASFDARTEQYWKQVRDALAKAPRVLVDPYTELVASFADVDHSPRRLGESKRELKEYGRDADALVSLGRAYLVIGRLRSARDAFRAATKADPLHDRAWWYRGVAALFARANREAGNCLRRALDQAPGDVQTETVLGVARFHARDYAAAEEHFQRTSGGARPVCRSLLGCSLRAQGKWDQARVELNLLRYSGSQLWERVALQCLDCVERGEQKKEGTLRARRRRNELLKSLGLLAAGAGWLAYSLAEHMFQSDVRIAAFPLLLLGVLFLRSLKGISGREQSHEFGNHEQGLPCWQATTWMRPKRSEF